MTNNHKCNNECDNCLDPFIFDSPNDINQFIAFQRIYHDEQEETNPGNQQSQQSGSVCQSETPWPHKGGISPQDPPKGLGKEGLGKG